MSTILFIRHAQASFGTDDYDRLSDLGKKQAARLGAYLSDIGVAFDAVFSGSMRRQTETAEIVLARLRQNVRLPELQLATDFDEYDSVEVFQSLCADLVEEDPSLSRRLPRILKDHKAFQRIFEEMVRRWVAGRHRRPVSESWQAFKRRVCGGVERVMDTCGQGSQVAVFTSAGALSAVMQKALGLSDERTVEVSWAVYNSAVSTFRYNRQRRFSLVSFNSVAHLKICRDAELLTYR